MLIKRTAKPLSYSSIRSYKTVYLWCSDGWMYDTVGMKKYKYIPMGEFLSVIREPFTRQSFSDVQYSEEIEVTILSEKPLIWVETGVNVGEMFEEVSKTSK